MILNDLEKEIKLLIKKRKSTQKEISEILGVRHQYLNRVLKRGAGNVAETFVRAIEVLGYDIRIEFRRRGKNE